MTTEEVPTDPKIAEARRAGARAFFIAGATALLLILGGGGGYVVKHNADVAHAKQVKAEKAAERAAKIEHAYQMRVADWRSLTKQWNAKNATYQNAKDIVDPVFTAADDLTGMIGAGGYDYDKYSETLQKVGAAYDRAARELPGSSAYTVVHDIRRAYNQWTDAGNIWREWQNNFDDTRKLDDLPLETHFHKAANNLTDAQVALDELKPGAQPVKPTRDGSLRTTADRPLTLS
jgi:hypothetical protein